MKRQRIVRRHTKCMGVFDIFNRRIRNCGVRISQADAAEGVVRCKKCKKQQLKIVKYGNRQLKRRSFRKD